jgi:glucosamine-6-phosphate deaminase
VHITVSPTVEAATLAATECLVSWLEDPTARSLMVACGNTPIDLYRRVAARKLSLGHLHVFALDEYVGVPPDEPRTVGNFLRDHLADPWGIPPERFFTVSSLEAEARTSIEEHERRVLGSGALDVIVLGLGQNGHIGFNEPGSARDSWGRVVELEAISIEANRRWFGGDYAPTKGATVGMGTVLAARRILVLAYGAHKAAAVKGMLEGPVTASCPASFFQLHPQVRVFLDEAAAAHLERRRA